MTVPDPAGRPDIERPIDLTDMPDHDERATPDRAPQHYPDDAEVPDDDSTAPVTEDPSVD